MPVARWEPLRNHVCLRPADRSAYVRLMIRDCALINTRSRLYRRLLLPLSLVWLPWLAMLAAGNARAQVPDSLACKPVDKAQLQAASAETLRFLRCRSRQLAYAAPRLKGLSQRQRDDLMFACLDQFDSTEHQLRVSYSYSREMLARESCDAVALPLELDPPPAETGTPGRRRFSFGR
jgi:hypothetical protein